MSDDEYEARLKDDPLVKRLAYCLWVELTGRAYINPQLPSETLEWADECGVKYTDEESDV